MKVLNIFKPKTCLNECSHGLLIYPLKKKKKKNLSLFLTVVPISFAKPSLIFHNEKISALQLGN